MSGRQIAIIWCRMFPSPKRLIGIFAHRAGTSFGEEAMKLCLTILLALSTCVALATSCYGQTAKSAQNAGPRKASYASLGSSPDWTGLWVFDFPGPGGGPPEQPVLTPKPAAELKVLAAEEAKNESPLTESANRHIPFDVREASDKVIHWRCSPPSTDEPICAARTRCCRFWTPNRLGMETLASSAYRNSSKPDVLSKSSSQYPPTAYTLVQDPGTILPSGPRTTVVTVPCDPEATFIVTSNCEV